MEDRGHNQAASHGFGPLAHTEESEPFPFVVMSRHFIRIETMTAVLHGHHEVPSLIGTDGHLRLICSGMLEHIEQQLPGGLKYQHGLIVRQHDGLNVFLMVTVNP